MNGIRLQRHLALVGMMGSGKSTVGRLLAIRIGVRCFDIDDLIVQERRVSISDIFANEGEERFRYYEGLMLRRVLSSESPVVVALGGGSLLSVAHQQLVKASADSFWLKASPATLLAHLNGDQSRPLLGSQYCEADLEAALRQRELGYKAVAPVVQETDGLSYEVVVENILCALQARSSGSGGTEAS